jgi:hypothetical protein
MDFQTQYLVDLLDYETLDLKISKKNKESVSDFSSKYSPNKKFKSSNNQITSDTLQPKSYCFEPTSSSAIQETHINNLLPISIGETPKINQDNTDNDNKVKEISLTIQTLKKNHNLSNQLTNNIRKIINEIIPLGKLPKNISFIEFKLFAVCPNDKCKSQVIVIEDQDHNSVDIIEQKQTALYRNLNLDEKTIEVNYREEWFKGNLLSSSGSYINFFKNF